MKLLTGCLVFGFLLILSTNARSQNKTSGIQGRLFLQNSLVADAASIVLINLRDSSVVAGATITKDGYFRFSNIAAADYVIRITHIGYLTYVSAPINLGAEVVDIPPITLMPSPAVLKEVTIANKKAFIDNRSDKTVLNVDKGIMASGVSVMEILNTAPGVKVNGSGDVLFKSGLKAAIAINGRLITLSPQDIAAQLQSMQSSGVGTIELIANPGAKYDASGPGGLINIVLKKSAAEGFNGSFDVSEGYGNFSKSRAGFNMNYRSGSINVFGSYNFSNNNTQHAIISDRDVGSNTNFNVNYFNHQKSYNNNYSGGLDYNIDAGHTIGLLVTGYYYKYVLDKNTVSAIGNFGRLDSTLTTSSLLNRSLASNNFNLNYVGKLGSTNQTLSADADFDVFNRRATEDLVSDLLNVRTAASSPTQYFSNFAPTHILTGSGRADYSNPLSKSAKLDAGAKFIAVKSDNRQEFNNVVGTTLIPDTKLSSQFIYTENITSAYTNFTGNPSAKLNYQLGLRVEHTESNANTLSEMYKIKRSYTDLFPSVSINYTPDPDHRLSFNYVRRIDRPDYQSLNPLIAYQDKYNFTSGNAYLRPSYTDRLEIKQIYKDKLTTSVYASFTHDPYNFTYFSQNDATGGFTSGKMNLKEVRTFGVNVDFATDVTKWWNLDLNADGSYLHYVDYAGKLNKDATDATILAVNSLTLPAGLTMEVTGSYEIPTFYYIYEYRSIYFVNAGIRKSLFNKLGSLNFTAEDVFNTSRDRYAVNYSNVRLDGFDKKETRIFRLTFSYRFGKSTVKSRKHVSGNNDDLKRLNAGG